MCIRDRCDPIWQVILHSYEMVFHEQLYQLYLYHHNVWDRAAEGMKTLHINMGCKKHYKIIT